MTFRDTAVILLFQKTLLRRLFQTPTTLRPFRILYYYYYCYCVVSVVRFLGLLLRAITHEAGVTTCPSFGCSAQPFQPLSKLFR